MSSPRRPPGGKLFGYAGIGLLLAAPTLTLATETDRGARDSAQLTPGVMQVSLTSPAADEMAFLPALTFRMGSTSEQMLGAFAECRKEPWGHRCAPAMFANEGPQRTVTVSAFWLDRKEVTVRDYRRCVELYRCARPAFNRGARRFEHDAFPVTMITWHDARDYCDFRGLRLPYEAEFERAARGTTGRTYPWGNLFNSRVSNHGRFGWDASEPKDGFTELAPVASFASGATREGIFDLAGNAAEWVQDFYAPEYDASDTNDPQGPKSAGPHRVLRGGSYESAAPWLRSATRVPAHPSTRAPTIGFRCARSDAREKLAKPHAQG